MSGGSLSSSLPLIQLLLILQLLSHSKLAELLRRQLLEVIATFGSATSASTASCSLFLLFGFMFIQLLLVLKLLGEAQLAQLLWRQLLESSIVLLFVAATSFGLLLLLLGFPLIVLSLVL